MRLGHQLSSVLEWVIATHYGFATEQVISFASKTMSLLAILRSNTVHGRRTVVYHDCEIPSVLHLDEIKTVYGYHIECIPLDSANEIASDADVTQVYLTNAAVFSNLSTEKYDATVNLSSDFGCY